MRPTPNPREPSPTAVQVTISGGRTCWVLPLAPQDPSYISAALNTSLGARPTADDLKAKSEAGDLEGVGSAAKRGTYDALVLFGLVYDCGPFALDTDPIEDIATATPAEVLAYAEALDAETRTRTGRQLISFGDVKACFEAAMGALTGAVETEKNG